MNDFPKGFVRVWCSALLYFVAYYALLVPVPLYLGRIGLPDGQIGLILGAFSVAALIGRPIAGAVSDHSGSRVVMLFGAGALAMGAWGMVLSRHFALLFACRLLQAFGYAAFTTAATARIAGAAAPHRRGSALAFYGISVNVAMTLTPGIVNASLGWLTIRGAFWFAGAVALGTCIYIAVAFDRSLDAVSHDNGKWRALIRVPSTFRVPMVMAAVFGIGYGAFLQFLPLLADRRRIGSAGLSYAVYGVSIIFTRLTTGRLMDAKNKRWLLGVSLFGLGTSLAGFAVADSVVWLLVSAALTAVASGILHPALIALHVDYAPEGQTGRAAGFFYLAFDFGIGASGWLLSPILQKAGLSGLYGAAALLTSVAAVLFITIRGSDASTPADSEQYSATRRTRQV